MSHNPFSKKRGTLWRNHKPSIQATVRHCALLCLIALCLAPLPRATARSVGSARAAQPDLVNTRVLVLHSYHQGFTWTDNISRGIQKAFAEHADQVEIIFEFMDARRIYTEEYFRQLQDLYRLKYTGKKVDVVIASDDQAFSFMMGPGQEIFPNVPIVFCSVSGYEPSMREEHPQLTGLLEAIDIETTLDTALRLHPDTREVAVITDMTRTGQALKAKAEAVFQNYEDRVQFRYLEHQTVDQLFPQVAALPDDTIVFLFIFSRDETGHVFSHEHHLRVLVEHCNVPIYSVWEFYLGHGIVGGMLTSGEEEGRIAGTMALRILQGEHASDIPLEKSPTRYMFDYAQMERFGIKESSLPENSIVINRPYSFYEEYKLLIWGVILVIGLLLSIVVALVLNILSRRRAEEALRQSQTNLQQTIDTVPEGMLLLDTDHRVILANPLGKKDLSALADAKVGDTLTHLANRPLEELLTSPPRGLWHELEADSRIFVIVARPIENGPTPRGWVLVIREVTKQREFEHHVHQQERLAAIGQLAAGIAHDFNNIMAVISLYAGMSLRTTDLPETVYERMGVINQQAHRASDLIQQVLDFSRRAVLERLPMELGTFLKELTKLLGRTLPENIQINLSATENEYLVNADPTRVQQMIMNLATNARDAMPEGGQLRIGLEKVWVANIKDAPLPDMTRGEWVRITVADTGCGIPADILPHIYDPFFTTKEPGRGTGLGLPQVYGIVKQHEGHIDVKSQEGEGTTFTVYLPSLAQLQPEPVSQETEALVQGQGQLILVVEDDAATRAALVDGLETLNYRVIEATNGREALSIFEKRAGQTDPTEQIALVLSDMVMPEMGGKALLYALREKSVSAKVVLLTGHPLDEGTFEDLKPQGLQSWLLKPLSIERLSQVVAEALEDK